MLESLLLWWHRRKTRRKMDRVFSRGEDPFKYRGSPYERERLGAMEAAVSERRWHKALEVGCAEGDFTERLVRNADEVTAVDISAVALERARRRLPGVAFVEADLRDWKTAERYDLIVLGDVLYYMDKPLVREAFEETFRKVTAWLAPGGCIMLAHAFAGPAERAQRQGFRERFEKLGLRLVSEGAVGRDGPVSCLLSVLEKP